MISTRLHGMIDYGVASALAAAAGAAPLGQATRRTLGAAGAYHASYSLVTDYELGTAPLVPMRTHLALDAIGAAALCGIGLLSTRAAPRDRALLVAIGLAELAVVGLTDRPTANPAAERLAPTYDPLDIPKSIAPDVWIVDSGPLRPLGAPLPVRMTVVRLPDGDLLLHSPTRCTPALKAALEQLGRIRHLIAPNSVHWMFLQDWQRACPNTVTWAAPGLRDRAQVRTSGVHLDRDLADTPPAEWRNAVDVVTVPGGLGFREVALFHRPSRTLLLTDLVVNLEARRLPLPLRLFARAMGATAPHGMAPLYVRAIFKLRRGAARAGAERLLALAPDRVVFSHGAWFEHDGTAALRRSLRWLLS